MYKIVLYRDPMQCMLVKTQVVPVLSTHCSLAECQFADDPPKVDFEATVVHQPRQTWVHASVVIALVAKTSHTC